MSWIVLPSSLPASGAHNFHPMPGAKHWCFTLNNYTDDDCVRLSGLVEGALCSYVIFGREKGTGTGTDHLQGYLSCRERKTLAYLKENVSATAHWEVRRGRSDQAIDYCKKDGDYREFGTVPLGQGSRNDIVRYKDWLAGLDSPPSERMIADNFTSLYMRYRSSCLKLAMLLVKQPDLETDEAKDWQDEILELVKLPADKRKIYFYVDEVGGVGKSWLMRRLITLYPDDVQVLGLGKRDDLSYAVDPHRSIFIFDIPRGGMDFICYDILEKLKDRVLFSPKYESVTKTLSKTPHVIVLSNEYPDKNKMTNDRYDITDTF